MKYRRKRKSKKRKNKTIKTLLFFLLFTFLIGSFTYFCFFSGFFNLETIEVKGIKKFPKEEVRLSVEKIINENRFSSFYNNILLLKFNLIEEEVLGQYPVIKNVQIKRELPNSIIVVVEEREEVAQICPEDCYLIDEEGIIFEIAKEEKPLLKIVFNDSEKELVTGKKIIDKDLLFFLIDFYSRIDRNLDFAMDYFLIISNKRTHVCTEEGWDIYLNPIESADWQFTKLQTVIKEHLSSEDRKVLDYIDLRFGNTASIQKK